MIYSLISNQISNSSFITAHILSWDSYVYMCGVSLFLNGMDPYDYIVLRDCLPDNWNFYFNMPASVIYLYLPFAKLTNFQWLFIINSINFFLLITSSYFFLRLTSSYFLLLLASCQRGFARLVALAAAFRGWRAPRLSSWSIL